MYKRLVSILTSLVIIIMSFNVCVFAEEPAQILVSSATIEQGTSNVDITIAIKNNPGIVSAKMTLEFDDNVLTLTKVTDKGVLGAAYHSPSLENPYNLYWNNGSVTENFTYNGEIASLSFSVNANASVGTYPIYISYDEDNILNVDMDNVFFNTIDGSITINNINQEVNVTGVSFDKTDLHLKINESATVNVIATPHNATNKAVTWTSSDINVAEVLNGVVAAKAAGTAVITATTEDGGYTASCTVTVTENVIPENAPKIKITDIKTLPGKEIQVTVDLSDNTGFASLGIEVGYDADIMTLTKVTPNSGVGATFTPAQNYSVNPYNMGWDSTTNITYNGNLATLTFTVAEDAPDGIYPITVDYYKGVNGNYVDGVNVNYNENFEAVGFVYVSGNVIVASYVPGNINGDDIVDNKDATYLLRYLAGWNLTGVVEDALDTDGNGLVDNKDATILLRYLAGWDVTLH